LKAGLDKCNIKIQQEIHNLKKDEIMGTTLTLAYVIWPRAYVLHIGDSRCYLMRDDCLFQITIDDTVGQDMIDKGEINPASVSDSIWNNILTDYVGSEANDGVSSHVHRIDLQADDSLLLCTDGLTCHLSDTQILKILSTSEDSKNACKELIRQTHLKGAADNTTIVLSQFNQFSQNSQINIPLKKVNLAEDTLPSKSTDNRPLKEMVALKENKNDS
jgi:serine/threonine protein phosphatase PrpC